MERVLKTTIKLTMRVVITTYFLSQLLWATQAGTVHSEKSMNGPCTFETSFCGYAHTGWTRRTHLSLDPVGSYYAAPNTSTDAILYSGTLDTPLQGLSWWYHCQQGTLQAWGQHHGQWGKFWECRSNTWQHVQLSLTSPITALRFVGRGHVGLDDIRVSMWSSQSYSPWWAYVLDLLFLMLCCVGCVILCRYCRRQTPPNADARIIVALDHNEEPAMGIPVEVQETTHVIPSAVYVIEPTSQSV